MWSVSYHTINLSSDKIYLHGRCCLFMGTETRSRFINIYVTPKLTKSDNEYWSNRPIMVWEAYRSNVLSGCHAAPALNAYLTHSKINKQLGGTLPIPELHEPYSRASQSPYSPHSGPWFKPIVSSLDRTFQTTIEFSSFVDVSKPVWNEGLRANFSEETKRSRNDSNYPRHS